MAPNTNDLFNSHEMKKGGQFVDLTIGFLDVLSIMQAKLALFKTLTMDFTL
jgi:hypothetical protein